MDMSIATRPEAVRPEAVRPEAVKQEQGLELLITRRAREIAEQEVRRVLGELLSRLQGVFSATVPVQPEHLTITQAARKYHLNENTIRRVTLVGKLPSTHRPVTSPRGTRQVLMVSSSDLDAWYRSR